MVIWLLEIFVIVMFWVSLFDTAGQLGLKFVGWSLHTDILLSGRLGEKLANLIEIFPTLSINQANSKRNVIKQI